MKSPELIVVGPALGPRPDPGLPEARAYKLLRLRKDQTLGPLFINRRQVIVPGVWLRAESHPTKGFAFRPGWHCSWLPRAPHLTRKGRVWAEVTIRGYAEFERPDHQGGMWLLGQWMRVERILSDADTESILKAAGAADEKALWKLQRQAVDR